MARKFIIFGVGAGAISLVVDGLAGLLLLRLLSEYLPPEAAGYWILVTATGSLLLLLQCGLGPTVARRIAQSLARNDTSLLAETVVSVRKAMVLVGGVVMLASLLAFMVQLRSAADATHQGWAPAAAWFVYAAGIALNLKGQGDLFVLNGLGHVGWDKILRTITSIISIIGYWWLLANGFGLLSISIVHLFLNAAFMFAAQACLRSIHGQVLPHLKASGPLLGELFRAGAKLFVLNIMGFAVTNFGLFVTEHRFGLGKLPLFAAMFKIGSLMAIMAGLVPNMCYPYISRYYEVNDLPRCRRYYLTGLVLSNGIFAVLALPTYIFAQPLFALWLGEGKYLGDTTFLLVLIFNGVLAHHTAQAMPALATAGHSFIVASIINGGLVVGLILLLSAKLGLPGIPLAMILGTVGPSAFVAYKAYHIFFPVSGGIPKPYLTVSLFR